jgi:hypothetical protein
MSRGVAALLQHGLGVVNPARELVDLGQLQVSRRSKWLERLGGRLQKHVDDGTNLRNDMVGDDAASAFRYEFSRDVQKLLLCTQCRKLLGGKQCREFMGLLCRPTHGQLPCQKTQQQELCTVRMQ